MKIRSVLRVIWKHIRRSKKGSFNVANHKICSNTVIPTYVSFSRPFPPSIRIKNYSVKEEYPLYAISPSSSFYESTYQEGSSDEYGYATISNESIFLGLRKDYQEMGGLRRVDCCSNLLDKSFVSAEDQIQIMRRLTSLNDVPKRALLTPPPQFMPICTSTPLVRSCVDLATTSNSKEKLRFYRLQNKQLSVPSFKPPPLPKETACKDDLIVLDDRERLWEVELPRDYSRYIGDDTPTLVAKDEPTLVPTEEPKLLNETYIEEVTIYEDPGTESPIANKTFVRSAKAAAKILWKLRQELLMSHSVNV